MKKILSFVGIVFILIVAAVAGRIGEEVGNQAFAPEPPSKEEMESGLIHGFEQAAEKINQDTPTMVDDETRMDKATVGPGALLTYHYTFPNYASDEIDSAWINSDLRESVTSSVCNSQEMKPSLQYGGTYRYAYSGSDQKLIGAFKISREDCGYAADSP